MPELFDTSGVPDDDPYWNALTARIVERAAARRTGLGWLAQSRARWAAGAALAAACALLFFSARAARPDAAGQGWAAALAPNDAGFRAVALGDRPPSIGLLLLAQSLRRERQ
jgi:hypothetical protein